MNYMPRSQERSAEEIVRYLGERRGREVKKPRKLAEFETAEDIRAAADELIALTEERQDLYAAIAQDEKLLGESVAALEEAEIAGLLRRGQLSAEDRTVLRRLEEARRGKIAQALRAPSDEEQLELIAAGEVDRLLQIERADVQIAPALARNKKEAEELSRRIRELSGDQRVLEAYRDTMAERIEVIRSARIVENCASTRIGLITAPLPSPRAAMRSAYGSRGETRPSLSLSLSAARRRRKKYQSSSRFPKFIGNSAAANCSNGAGRFGAANWPRRRRSDA